MVFAQAISESGLLTQDAIMEVLTKGLGGRFAGQKVLALIPDHTRSLPLPELFRMVVEVLHDVRELNVMVALGTHPGYSEEGLNHLVGITAQERATGDGFQMHGRVLLAVTRACARAHLTNSPNGRPKPASHSRSRPFISAP